MRNCIKSVSTVVWEALSKLWAKVTDLITREPVRLRERMEQLALGDDKALENHDVEQNSVRSVMMDHDIVMLIIYWTSCFSKSR